MSTAHSLRRLFFGAGAAVLAVLACLIAGIVLFAHGLDRQEPLDITDSEGIVVLTGGADRITEALGLLNRQKGRRLLISGVNMATTPESLRRLAPTHAALFECCVDLDYHASNTRSNAAEAARWARGLGYRSLILVTASYHMPRARLEFVRAMPEINIRTHPVVPDASRIRRWWQDGALTRIIAMEYLKYQFARIRGMLGL